MFKAAESAVGGIILSALLQSIHKGKSRINTKTLRDYTQTDKNTLLVALQSLINRGLITVDEQLTDKFSAASFKIDGFTVRLACLSVEDVFREEANDEEQLEIDFDSEREAGFDGYGAIPKPRREISGEDSIEIGAYLYEAKARPIFAKEEDETPREWIFNLTKKMLGDENTQILVENMTFLTIAEVWAWYDEFIEGIKWEHDHEEAAARAALTIDNEEASESVDTSDGEVPETPDEKAAGPSKKASSK